MEKSEDPAMQLTMKVEKIIPKGRLTSSSPSFGVSPLRAGVHMNTNISATNRRGIDTAIEI